MKPWKVSFVVSFYGRWMSVEIKQFHSGECKATYWWWRCIRCLSLPVFFFFNFGRCSVVCAHPSSLEDFPSPAFMWSSGRVRRHCEQTTRVGLSRLALLSFTSRDGNPTADCWDWGRWPNDKRDKWCSMQTVLLQFYVNQLWFDNNDWTFAGWWNSRVRFRPRPLKHGLFHPFK